jgi:hypothetical protein
VPDWLRPPLAGAGLPPDVPGRLEIDDDLGGLDDFADLPGPGEATHVEPDPADADTSEV